MDQSIGEVTTVMGAMITELMRRSLRGGVLKIGEELQTLVVDKVDSAVAERVPEMERAAMAAAEQTAQIAAAKVAAEEVHALDVKTGETTRRLESQIEGVGKEARGIVEEKAQALTGKLGQLETRIEGVGQETRGVVEEKAQALTGKIDEVDRKAAEATRQAAEAAHKAAEQLSGQIVETEKRVCELTQTEIDQRLASVVEKSREAATMLKTRLKAVEDLSETLGQQIRDERASREGELRTGFAKLQQHFEQLSQTMSQGTAQTEARFQEELAGLRKTNEALAARVAELEKPKGFFSRWFGKKKEKELGQE
jgi:hypothetical protein